jgi:DNA-binding MarR family transcriptional regulator
MNGLESSSTTSLAASLRGTVMRVARRLRSERVDGSLGLAALVALGTIESHEPLTASELAAAERLQPSSTTRLISVLEKHGFIVRDRDPADGRQSILRMTPAGREVVATERERRQEWLAHVLDGFTTEERDQLRAVIPLLHRIGEA